MAHKNKYEEAMERARMVLVKSRTFPDWVNFVLAYAIGYIFPDFVWKKEYPESVEKEPKKGL